MSARRIYVVHKIVTRWVLTERRARWLVRSIPDRENQTVFYRRRRFGYRITINHRHYKDDER